MNTLEFSFCFWLLLLLRLSAIWRPLLCIVGSIAWKTIPYVVIQLKFHTNFGHMQMHSLQIQQFSIENWGYSFHTLTQNHRNLLQFASIVAHSVILGNFFYWSIFFLKDKRERYIKRFIRHFSSRGEHSSNDSQAITRSTNKSFNSTQANENIAFRPVY